MSGQAFDENFTNIKFSEEIENFRIKEAPSSVYYIPNFITEEEERYLVNQVDHAPKPKWTQLSNRKLQNWGGLPDPKGMIPEKLPQWLETYCKRIADLGAFEGKLPNHVLVNEYLPGQGIMPHEDGPLYYPTVTTISLGSHTLLDFYYHLKTSGDEQEPGEETSLESRHFLSILLEPRSLFISRDDMYKVHLHGIAERTEDILTEKVVNIDQCKMSLGLTLQRTRRISLTIRHVPKVMKAKLLFGKR
ncbi:alpha-ketoglutarate-dependent dioxygenase alkB homolog 6-like [Lineus longissimus]|uniref:alpha-ketoglutarate-dependent dioxygenase alkB homolog 6-like n=1 Tax=Lineus longissimus TaxID=88925 RepID=UPI002B4D4B9E